MKKIIVSAAVSLGSVLGMSVPAMAQSSISNTGPGSNNTIVDNSSVTCTSVMTNSAIVTNTTNQTGSSGSANVSGNTTGGSATSGNVGNNSSTNTQLSMTNSNPCLPASPVPTGGGGGGAGGGSPVVTSAITLAGGQGAGAAEVTSLPSTGPTPPAEQLFISSSLLSGLVVVGATLRKFFDQAS